MLYAGYRLSLRDDCILVASNPQPKAPDQSLICCSGLGLKDVLSLGLRGGVLMLYAGYRLSLRDDYILVASNPQPKAPDQSLICCSGLGLKDVLS